MFGHQNDQSKNTKVVPDESIHVGMDSNTGGALAPTSAPEPPLDAAPAAYSEPASDHSDQPAEPAEPADDTPANNGPAPISDIVNTGSMPSGPASAPPMPPPAPEPGDDLLASDSSTHELIDIKQQALGALSPLVGHLEQEPVDKFRTTMMMIQASDDHTLIKTAYEAAKQIEDEKTRAQALLDIVNEINYFTQHQQS